MEQLKWFDYLYPTLKCLDDGNIRKRHELIEMVANFLSLDKHIRSELTASGEPIYANRIGWAMTYLKQSGLIESPKRAHFCIAKLGIKHLAENPKSLTEKDLEQYPGYIDFIGRKKVKKIDTSDSTTVVNNESSSTPDELLELASQEIRETVCLELLESAKKITPLAFENLVIDLLKKMGYGDVNDPMSGIRVGGTGDGGIDGIINQDKLGLDRIYVQAKRYQENNTVGAKIVREFIGALATKGASKGIIITTSSFSEEAKKHAIDTKTYTIILIDGKRLSELMYDNDVGVAPKKQITIKKIDSDYFEI